MIVFVTGLTIWLHDRVCDRTNYLVTWTMDISNDKINVEVAWERCKIRLKSQIRVWTTRYTDLIGRAGDHDTQTWSAARGITIHRLDRPRGGSRYTDLIGRAGMVQIIQGTWDALLLKNWRPITPLNQDYKLASKAIATRLCGVLPKIIHSDQTGFLKDRFVGENIIRITNIMDFLNETKKGALLLSAEL